VEREILRTKGSIAEGKTIAEPLQGSKVFPGMVVQMISGGEQTGAMDAMLGKIADFYDDEVDTAVDALTSLLDPCDGGPGRRSARVSSRYTCRSSRS
jgi:type IV pilus assembly protein PilC